MRVFKNGHGPVVVKAMCEGAGLWVWVHICFGGVGQSLPLFERLDSGHCIRSSREGAGGSRCVPRVMQPHIPRRTPACRLGDQKETRTAQREQHGNSFPDKRKLSQGSGK